MKITTGFKSVTLAACVVLGAFSLPAMADADGKCDRNLAIDYLVAPEATPKLVEFLRNAYGAKVVRVELPGKGYSKELDSYRLKIQVNENNMLVRQYCG